jgi:hypothetical protein
MVENDDHKSIALMRHGLKVTPVVLLKILQKRKNNEQDRKI